MRALSKLYEGLALIAFALLLMHTQSAMAHRAKHVFTTITYGASGTLEVVHQLHLHDASQALSVIENSRTAEVLTLEGQAKLLLHIEDQFELRDENGNPIPLVTIGAEVEGPHLYMLFESGEIDAPKTLNIRHPMLMDIFPDQRNQLNATIGKSLKSHLFKDAESWTTLSF